MNNRGLLYSHRRSLQLALGLIWLLDAALQFQPYMFTKAFPHQVLAPVGPGNPGWIAQPVHWSARLTAEHEVIANAVFATVQLLIALGLFTRATVRVALVGSALWALGVWWLGEGLGGVFLTAQSPIMGAPGAALIYALISILIWPRDTTSTKPIESVATTGALPGVIARSAWVALWGSFAFESLQAANRAPSALHDLIAGMAAGEPGWLRAVDRHSAGTLGQHGTGVSIALAVIFGVIALTVFANRRVRRSGLVVAIIVAAVIWLVGQNLGAIATGEATDPNTGPLLILLAAAYWPLPSRRLNPTIDVNADPARFREESLISG